ncbi:hypothetical protein IC235_06200 [Hymenobacter sp. BT664]|uniref:Uncharacterized protein n=1 Tax=Hymenobacter montanus TaxID=2771359 RepID=A0A927BB68_9BACT|nr:hypothetical protein [Hymenobacter montanus]MBD2767481.1 hypothetical protein [Hymenobacter montanus]
MSRTSWQTDTVTFTPTTNITHLSFWVTGSTGYYTNSNVVTQGTLLIDNLRTLTGIVLKKADGTAQAAGKAFRLLWQPILTVGDLDSLAPRPQLRGTVSTFRGGRVPLPPALQVTDAKGFYFFQEAAPAAGQDTLYYGLYIRNKPLANGAKDDTLRHLYQCRRTFGSQAGLLADSLAPLGISSPRAARAYRAALKLPAAAPASAPRRPDGPIPQNSGRPLTPRPRPRLHARW